MWDKITGAEGDIWAYEGGSNKMLKKMHNEYFHDLYSSANMLSDKIIDIQYHSPETLLFLATVTHMRQV
jgi:hypothetical protein